MKTYSNKIFKIRTGLAVLTLRSQSSPGRHSEILLTCRQTCSSEKDEFQDEFRTLGHQDKSYNMQAEYFPIEVVDIDWDQVGKS